MPKLGVKGDPSAAAVSLGMDRKAILESEVELEKAVSEYLGRLTFVCMPINDKPGPASMRGYVERNAIALLSNYERDPPSGSWLGLSSNRPSVVKSGLWNQSHVSETHVPDFILGLDRLVSEA